MFDFQKYLTNQGVLKMAKIKMKNSVAIAGTFHDFPVEKKMAEVSEKTLLTDGQHFSAVGKHHSYGRAEQGWFRGHDCQQRFFKAANYFYLG